MSAFFADFPDNLPPKFVAGWYVAIGAFLAPWGLPVISAAFLIAALALLQLDE